MIVIICCSIIIIYIFCFSPLEIVFLLELLNPRLQGSNTFKELYLKLTEKAQIQLTDVISIPALLEILKTPEYSDQFNLTHL